jgi:hypothetical protein
MKTWRNNRLLNLVSKWYWDLTLMGIVSILYIFDPGTGIPTYVFKSFVVLALAITFIPTFFEIREKIRFYSGLLRRRSHVTRPPASLLLSIITIFPKKYRQCLEQEISDMRIEYYEILAEGKTARARTVSLFYYLGLFWSVISWILHNIVTVFLTAPKKN